MNASEAASQVERMAMVRGVFVASALVLLAGCGPAEIPEAKVPVEPEPLLPQPSPSGSAVAGEPLPSEAEVAFKAMLERVSSARGLAVLAPVKLRTIDRATAEKMIRDKAERELPHDVLEHETEALVALGLVPPSYDATDGMFSMIGTSISGFYEPDDKTMYLASDLKPAERDETLAHELVHALQDQHYDLGPLFKYRPDDDERTAAGHAFTEGDATSAMFDVARGDKMGVEEERFAKVARQSIEQLAPDVPAVLRESLMCPYIDGFAFVQTLRRRGDFAAVDAVWKSLPVTTEQLLHIDKYDAKEPALDVAAPSLTPLANASAKRSFTKVYTQTIGEQGLRIVLGAWTEEATAARAAAGWGGDRYVLARGEGAAAGETALGWLVRFDSEKDAKEMASVLSAQAHGECVSRPDTGPFAWSRKRRDIALVMGPYLRTGTKVKSTGTCKEAKVWLTAMLTGSKN